MRRLDPIARLHSTRLESRVPSLELIGFRVNRRQRLSQAAASSSCSCSSSTRRHNTTQRNSLAVDGWLHFRSTSGRRDHSQCERSLALGWIRPWHESERASEMIGLRWRVNGLICGPLLARLNGGHQTRSIKLALVCGCALVFVAPL